jgi:hypothetical protein
MVKKTRRDHEGHILLIPENNRWKLNPSCTTESGKGEEIFPQVQMTALSKVELPLVTFETFIFPYFLLFLHL